MVYWFSFQNHPDAKMESSKKLLLVLFSNCANFLYVGILH